MQYQQSAQGLLADKEAAERARAEHERRANAAQEQMEELRQVPPLQSLVYTAFDGHGLFRLFVCLFCL